jgi:hypothetical protein
MLTITPAPLTARLTNPAQSKVYGEDDSAVLGAGVTLGGLINRTVSTWNGDVAVNDAALTSSATSLVRAAGENVGTYAITGGTFSASTVSYSVPVFDGSNNPALTIMPAPLTIRADDKTRPVGLPNPPFTATYSGLVFGETPAVLAGSLIFATSADTLSPAGSYPIVPSGQSSGNYAITYLTGTLTAVVAAPARRNPIDSSIFSPQIAALQQLGVGEFANEASDCMSATGSPSGVKVAISGRPGKCGAGRVELIELTPRGNVRRSPPVER